MSDYERIRSLVKRHANSDERERLLAYLEVFQHQMEIVDAIRQSIAKKVKQDE